jgi:hypothetical protein
VKLVLAAAALLAAAPAAAQQPRSADVRINQLIVYGADPCPKSTEEEITVCARRPEDDRFRIPENLRGNRNDPTNRTWADKAIELSYVGRTGIGSCTPVGPGGQIGCFNQLIDQARAEYEARDEVNWTALVEKARQERLGRIDAESEAIEREQAQPR